MMDEPVSSHDEAGPSINFKVLVPYQHKEEYSKYNAGTSFKKKKHIKEVKPTKEERDQHSILDYNNSRSGRTSTQRREKTTTRKSQQKEENTTYGEWSQIRE
jgi:hypothetical protein